MTRIIFILTISLHIINLSTSQEAPPPIFDIPPTIELPKSAATTPKPASTVTESSTTVSTSITNSTRNNETITTSSGVNSTVTNDTITTTVSLTTTINDAVTSSSLNVTSEYKSDKTVLVSETTTVKQASTTISENDTITTTSVYKSDNTSIVNEPTSTVPTLSTESTTARKKEKSNGIGIMLPPPPPIIPEPIGLIIQSNNPTTTVASDKSTIQQNETLTKTPNEKTTSNSSEYINKDVILPNSSISDVPSLKVEEKPGTTTVEISSIVHVLGNTSLDLNDTYDNTSVTETTTASDFIITTTNISTTIASSTNQTSDATSKVQKVANERISNQQPKEKKHVTVPVHPPPIFRQNRPPSIFDTGRQADSFRYTQSPPTTTEIIPPPIILPNRAVKITRDKVKPTTAKPRRFINPYVQTPEPTPEADPRYMSTLELAIFALKNLRKQKLQEAEASLGVQTFFPTTPGPKPSTVGTFLLTSKPTTRKIEIITIKAPVYPVVTQAPVESLPSEVIVKPEATQNEIIYDKDYYMNKYVLNQNPETKAANNIPQNQRNVQTQQERLIPQTTEASKRFFDANYLLSMIGSNNKLNQQTTRKVTTERPTTKLVNRSELNLQRRNPDWTGDIQLKNEAINKIRTESNPDSQMKNSQIVHTETKPLNWDPNVNSQPTYVDYNNKQQPLVKQQFQNVRVTTTPPRSRYAMYKPRDHVYGSTKLQPLTNDPGQALRERFNRKWLHQNTKVDIQEPAPVPQIQTISQYVPSVTEVTTYPPTTTESSVRRLFNLIFNIPRSKPFAQSNANHIRQPTFGNNVIGGQTRPKQQRTVTTQPPEAPSSQQLDRNQIDQLQSLINHKRKLEQQTQPKTQVQQLARPQKVFSSVMTLKQETTTPSSPVRQPNPLSIPSNIIQSEPQAIQPDVPTLKNYQPDTKAQFQQNTFQLSPEPAIMSINEIQNPYKQRQNQQQAAYKPQDTALPQATEQQKVIIQPDTLIQQKQQQQPQLSLQEPQMQNQPEINFQTYQPDQLQQQPSTLNLQQLHQNMLQQQTQQAEPLQPQPPQQSLVEQQLQQIALDPLQQLLQQQEQQRQQLMLQRFQQVDPLLQMQIFQQNMIQDQIQRLQQQDPLMQQLQLQQTPFEQLHLQQQALREQNNLNYQQQQEQQPQQLNDLQQNKYFLQQPQMQPEPQPSQQILTNQDLNIQPVESMSNQNQNTFPIAAQMSQSEVRDNAKSEQTPFKHTFTPQVSSIHIFQAPAFRFLRQKPKSIQSRATDTGNTNTQSNTLIDTGRKSQSRSPRDQLSVSYNRNQNEVMFSQYQQQTTNAPVDLLEAQSMLQSNHGGQVLLKLHKRFSPSTTRPTTTITTSTTTPQPTVPPTADPNPPPIFDTKVQVTFMPMPKITFTTPSPSNGSGVAEWDNGGKTGFDERCHGCVFVNDRCLLPDPVHCNIYIECVRQRSFVRAFIRECALGSFFDRKSFLCVDPKNADCPTDRCREPGLKWYGVHGHCKHYWSCVLREGGGAYAQSECCPDMGGFVEGQGCIENPNCTESCSSPILTGSPKGCQLRKTNNPTVYFDGDANIERPCAPGTLFNERACTCVQDVSIERSKARPEATMCEPFLTLDFTNNRIEDTSQNKQHIGVEGVTATREGVASYSGSDRLVVWRYANLMFPLVFALRFRFMSTSFEPRFQTIISNCDQKASREASFEISLDTLYREVIIKIDTYEGPAKRFKIMYAPNRWTDVDIIYDGERLVGAVDKRTRNIFAAGGIETRPTPLGIGACGDTNGFVGLIDDVNIYEECVPDQMYGIFMSVLE